VKKFSNTSTSITNPPMHIQYQLWHAVKTVHNINSGSSHGTVMMLCNPVNKA